MPEQSLQDLSLYVVLLVLLILVVLLVMMLVKQHRQSLRTLELQLRRQTLMSQSLMNQLRSPSVGTLVGLNQATLPKNAVASNSDIPEQVLTGSEFNEAIAYEEQAAMAGYDIYEPPPGMDAQGWESHLVKKED